MRAVAATTDDRARCFVLAGQVKPVLAVEEGSIATIRPGATTGKSHHPQLAVPLFD